MCGDDQLAIVQISVIYTPLNKAHEVVMPLAEIALTLWGKGRPLLLYARGNSLVGKTLLRL